MPEPVVQQRFVPGAPPPAPLSKSQRKKRKAKTKGDAPEDHPVSDPTAAALIEKAPEPADIQQGTVASELVVQDSQAPSIQEEDVIKLSPIVELVSKRLKATNKKIVRHQPSLYIFPSFVFTSLEIDAHRRLRRDGSRKAQ